MVHEPSVEFHFCKPSSPKGQVSCFLAKMKAEFIQRGVCFLFHPLHVFLFRIIYLYGNDMVYDMKRYEMTT